MMLGHRGAICGNVQGRSARARAISDALVSVIHSRTSSHAPSAFRFPPPMVVMSSLWHGGHTSAAVRGPYVIGGHSTHVEFEEYVVLLA